MAAASGIGNVIRIPEVKRRVLFTLMMLAVYRVGCAVPTPGIDADALSAFFAKYKGTLLGLFDMFSGGALERMSIFALGIMPYISASIILELLTVVIPHLAALKKEGEAGRKKISQYARYGTVALSLVQGLGIAMGLESMTSPRRRHGGAQSGLGFQDPHHDNPHLGHRVHYVDGRADHRAGYWKRHLPDHIRRHRGAHAQRHKQHLPDGAPGRDEHLHGGSSWEP